MTELLQSNHDRDSFDCGNELLNQYLKTQAGQDIRKKISVCYVLCPSENRIQGYYTLSQNSIPLEAFPPEIQKKFPPSYRSIPTTLLGRLAIHQQDQGKGLGKIILIDALKRCWETAQKIGSFAVVVDPNDQAAVQFYQKYDFIALADSKKMLISMKTLDVLFR